MRISELWDEMMSLERRIDDLFRGLVGPRFRSFFPALPALPSALERPFVPPCDVYRKDGEMVVRLELPGIDPEKDVKVTIEDGDLVIRGERKRTEEIKEEDYYRMETSYGSFERWIPLPEGVKEEDIRAEYHDGLLEIHVPAQELAPSKKVKAIPVKTTVTAKAA